jgi:hypothetical protein
MGTTSSASSVKEFEALLADPAAPGPFWGMSWTAFPIRCDGSSARRSPRGHRLRVRRGLRCEGRSSSGAAGLPFRGHEVLSPHRGLVWAVRTGGVISGSDRYLTGQGSMDWKLFGLVRVVHADGPDVSRSAAGRVVAEAVWVPSALLPRFEVAWTALDDRHIAFSYRLDDTDLDVRCMLDDDGRVSTIVLERWGIRIPPASHAAICSDSRRLDTRPSMG